MAVWVLIYACMGLAPGNENGMNGNISGYVMERPYAKVFLTEADCVVARERYAADMARQNLHPDNEEASQ